MTRPVALCLGLLTLAAAWLGALSALPGPFSAHMAQHMALVAVAAPLLALGVAQTRFDPARQAPALFAAVPASIVELVVVWGWHTPALHHAARHSALGFGLEQASFLLSALWLWCSAFGGAPSERAARRGAGILGLLLTSMHMTLLGALLALPPRVLYAHEHVGATPGARGEHASHGPVAGAAEQRLGPLDDQHLGGAIMIVLGGVSYLAGGLWLATGLVRSAAGTGARISVARAQGSARRLERRR